ncbi:MAG: DUF3857 domain-containing protein [Balneola sp.]
MKTRINFIFLFLLISGVLVAQPKKFGKVSSSELTQKFSAADSNFNAVVLFDYGQYSIEKDFVYTVERHKRIKILNENGLGEASFRFVYNPTRDYDQKLDKVEAFTFNLNSKGKVDRIKFDDKNLIVQDMEGGFKSVSFTMPQAKAGTIIDIRYILELGSAGQLPNWYFDDSIPVKWSELVAEIPNFHRFDIISRISSKLDINEAKPTEIGIRYEYKPENTNYVTKKLRMSSPAQKFRWAMKDVSPIISEPYLSSYENYRSYILLQFTGIDIPNYSIKEDYTSSWQEVSNTLLEDEDYGGRLKTGNWVTPVLENIGDFESQKNQLESIFSYVNSFNWNGSNRIYTTKNLQDVNKDKSGNSVELNLLLVLLLREAGFNADPLILSTRSNGRIIKGYILPDQFNKTIAVVNLDEEKYFLDATSEFNTTMLSRENLNEAGLRVKEFNAVWEPLVNSDISKTEIDVDYKLKDDSSVQGSINLILEGEDALYFKKSFYQDSVALLKEYLGFEGRDLVIEGTNFEGGTFYKPTINFSADFNVTALTNESNNESIYIDPASFQFLGLEELTNSYRVSPIEFPSKFIRKIDFRIELPEGYQVDGLPDDTTIVVPDKIFNYVEYYGERENVVIVEKNLVGLDNQLPRDSYPTVKSIFSIISKPPKTIVIKKVGE